MDEDEQELPCDHEWEARASNFDDSGKVLFCPKCRALKPLEN